jgi:multidomain signaling protein FimX
VNEGEILHLVIIEEPGDKAESHALTLRDAGLCFRTDTVHDIGSRKNRLDSALPDMVICGEGPGIPDPESVIGLLYESRTGIPLIILANETSEAAASITRSTVIDTRVSYGQSEDLLADVSRGSAYALLHRNIVSLEQSLMESKLVCHALMETCRDTTAYIQDDRHIYTNHAYRRISGYAQSEELSGIFLLDLVAPEHREHFTRRTHEHGMHDNRVDSLVIRCIQSNGEGFDAKMELSAASAIGGPCNGLIIRIRTREEDTGKLCIAEHVDNSGSLARLWQFGVDYIQGNFVQEPGREFAYDFESEVG